MNDSLLDIGRHNGLIINLSLYLERDLPVEVKAIESINISIRGNVNGLRKEI